MHLIAKEMGPECSVGAFVSNTHTIILMNLFFPIFSVLHFSYSLNCNVSSAHVSETNGVIICQAYCLLNGSLELNII